MKKKTRRQRRMHERTNEMGIILLAGIVAICTFLGVVEGLVWIWEKIDPPAEVKEVRVHHDSRIRTIH